MRVVHKVHIQGREITIHVPEGTTPLSVAVLDGKLMLWYERRVTYSPNVSWHIRVVGTGQEFDSEGYKFLGTVFVLANETHSRFGLSPKVLVWHVYLKEE